jgi:hypothetical protein
MRRLSAPPRARRRRRRIPDRGEVGSEGEKAIAFFQAENARLLRQLASEFFVCRRQISQCDRFVQATSYRQMSIVAKRKGTRRCKWPSDPGSCS